MGITFKNLTTIINGRMYTDSKQKTKVIFDIMNKKIINENICILTLGTKNGKTTLLLTAMTCLRPSRALSPQSGSFS